MLGIQAGQGGLHRGGDEQDSEGREKKGCSEPGDRSGTGACDTQTLQQAGAQGTHRGHTMIRRRRKTWGLLKGLPAPSS